MNQDTTNPPRPNPGREGQRELRRYFAPSIVHRESVETVAADCSIPGGKGDPTCSVGFS